MDLSRVAWIKLTSKQKAQRKLALEVLRLMRKGESFSIATKETGISNYLAKKSLGMRLIKKSGRILPTKTDSIQRSMEFYDRARGRIFITVKNSKDASKIGEYFSSSRNAIRTGKKSYLKKFKGKAITDAEGQTHYFETDLDRVYDLEEEIEEPEFREIYEGVEA